MQIGNPDWATVNYEVFSSYKAKVGGSQHLMQDPKKIRTPSNNSRNRIDRIGRIDSTDRIDKIDRQNW